MSAAVTPLAGLLRLVQSVPETTDNFRTLREIAQGMTNLINDEEKRDDE